MLLIIQLILSLVKVRLICSKRIKNREDNLIESKHETGRGSTIVDPANKQTQLEWPSHMKQS